MERLDWYSYFDSIAEQVSARATCPRAQVGAVIASPDTHTILTTGYNGAPRGQKHCTDAGCELEELTDGTTHCVRVVHAEMNAIINAAREGIAIKGASLHLHSSDGRPPCQRCEVAMRQAGILRWYTNARADL